MYECISTASNLSTELLLIIFKMLPAKDLINCRCVCSRWKDLVEALIKEDMIWNQYCESDYKSVYKEVRKNCKQLTWFETYRSLKLWGLLESASESIMEFSYRTNLANEIESIRLVENAKLVVVKTRFVAFYDLHSLQLTNREDVMGNFQHYEENDNYTVTYTVDLNVNFYFNKSIYNEENAFQHVKLLLNVDKCFYLVNASNEILELKIHNDHSEQVQVIEADHNIIALSNYNGCLHYLTSDGDVYALRNKKTIKILQVITQPLFDCIWRYNFLETMDWTWFYNYAEPMRDRVSVWLLRCVNKIKQHGDVFLIGTTDGFLLIYYKPFTKGMLDFINRRPVKIYNFNDAAKPIAKHPVRAIEVLDKIDGHKVLVALPNRVVVLTFKHDLKNPSGTKIPFSMSIPACRFLWD